MNARHPDRNALERFSRGQASAAEERWIEDHLRSGCAVCQPEIDALLLLTLTPAPFGELRPEDLAFDPEPGPEPGPEETTLEGLGWDRLFATIEQRLALVSVERRDAAPLVAELLSYPPGERQVLARNSGRFQTLAVCELLIDMSFEEGFRDAPRSIELAELGLLMAGLLDEERYGFSVVRDLEARAWAFLGNARRIAFDLPGAEEALVNAERVAEEGSADPLEEARILDLRASLLSDQGRFEQAAELLDAVIDIYDDLHEPHRKGRAMVSKGVVLGYAGWPEEAIRQIRRGLGLLDWEREPRLVLMARHNLAWFLNDCGKSEEALHQLERFRHTYQEYDDSWIGLRLSWLAGRIAMGLGHFEEAEQALREVKLQFLAGGHGYDASLVTLDLAHLYLKEERLPEVRALAEEMLAVFLSHDIHHQALAALGVFQKAAQADGATPGLVDEIAHYLRRARRNPRLRFVPAAA
jgi:tetratricopeptide (TPR) repeat protein